MTWIIACIFGLGYLAVVLEHSLKINKAAAALVAGVLCWTAYIVSQPDKQVVLQQLSEHLSEIAGVLFFLLSAMVIVELMDAHDGFELITARIRTAEKRKLLWLMGTVTFLLSAVLDNLTTTIVVLSVLRKLIARREDRLRFAGMVVIAANAGGCWSPMGDVTTTMLWVGGQITALNIVKALFLPSAVCLLVPLLILHFQLKGQVESPAVRAGDSRLTSSRLERNLVFGIGLGALVLVPVFKTMTHLPPFMAILLGLGLMWILTEMIHSGKDEFEKGTRSVVYALRKIDTPSILFFLGILLSIAALESVGALTGLALWLDRMVGNVTFIGVLFGFLSAVIDNVPLVAAVQGMYSLEQYPADHYFWELLAYCTGTGGSVLIIGSAAGVAAMGLEPIDFYWYLKRISLLALLGYLAGVVVYAAQSALLGW